MRILFIFLDGIGLGADDPSANPFARARMPTVERLLGGRRLIAPSAPTVADNATLLALDATLGVQGLPQSATGQAVLLTGINIPAQIGEHYGPKPNAAVSQFLLNGNLFSELGRIGRSASLLNAYPPRYFRSVLSGKRLHSSIPLAVTSAGIRLLDKDDLFAGRALSADFTGAAWVDMLGYPDAPVLTPDDAGKRLAQLSAAHDFSLFEYWSTDYAGHKQDMPWALEQLETFDAVIQGVVSAPRDDLLTLITSDHGNMEDLATRRHTDARVPALLIGPAAARRSFADGLHDLTDVAPAIRKILASPA